MSSNILVFVTNFIGVSSKRLLQLFVFVCNFICNGFVINVFVVFHVSWLDNVLMNFFLLKSSTCRSPVKKSYNLLNIELPIDIYYQLLGSHVCY